MNRQIKSASDWIGPQWSGFRNWCIISQLLLQKHNYLKLSSETSSHDYELIHVNLAWAQKPLICIARFMSGGMALVICFFWCWVYWIKVIL